MCKIALLMILIVAFVSRNGCEASADSSALAVIGRYIKASGGEALGGIKTEIRTGTLHRGSTGKVPLKSYWKTPGKWRYDQTYAWGDQASYGFDGMEAWSADTGGVGPMEQDQLLDFRFMFGAQAPLELAGLFPELKVKDKGTEAEPKVTIIQARSTHGLVRELAFSNETGLLLRAGKIRFDDYREVGDCTLPYRIVLGDTAQGRLPLIMQFNQIEHNIELDDDLFVKPVCRLELTKPPLHKERNPIEADSAWLQPLVGVYQHPTDTTKTYTVSTQGNHLMIEVTGSGYKVELKPESKTDFFIKFPDQEFHFLSDSAGNITRLAFGSDRSRLAVRIGGLDKQ